MFFRNPQQKLTAIHPPMVTLKNGTEIEKSFVNLIMRALNELSQINYGALCQIVAKCNDPNFEITAHAKDTLEKLGLIDSLGLVNSDTQNIVLSAFMEACPEASMTLSDPIALHSFTMKSKI